MLKFAVGDILLKKVRDDDDDDAAKWIIETDEIGAPIKYVYAFENELGIGYIKKLDNSGKGPTKGKAICVTKIVQRHEQLILDPDYAEHLLLSSGEEFKYNARYEAYKTFRDEALKKNKAIAIPVVVKRVDPHDLDDYEFVISPQFKQLWKNMKVGDKVYTDDEDSELEDGDMSQLGNIVYEIVKITKSRSSMTFKVLEDKYGYFDVGDEVKFNRGDFCDMCWHVTTQKPYPLTEDNI
jgi:hypothetical protein